MAEFKGFMGSTALVGESPQNMTDSFERGVFALLCGRPAEAYLYFLKSDLKQSAVLYNIAICFYISGNYNKALSYLDGALRFLPALSEKAFVMPQELERYEEQSCGYKAPMTMSTARLYPNRCRISMLRLKADILFALGSTDELKKLLPALAGRNYKNIEMIKKELNKE